MLNPLAKSKRQHTLKHRHLVQDILQHWSAAWSTAGSDLRHSCWSSTGETCFTQLWHLPAYSPWRHSRLSSRTRTHHAGIRSQHAQWSTEAPTARGGAARETGNSAFWSVFKLVPFLEVEQHVIPGFRTDLITGGRQCLSLVAHSFSDSGTYLLYAHVTGLYHFSLGNEPAGLENCLCPGREVGWGICTWAPQSQHRHKNRWAWHSAFQELDSVILAEPLQTEVFYDYKPTCLHPCKCSRSQDLHGMCSSPKEPSLLTALQWKRQTHYASQPSSQQSGFTKVFLVTQMQIPSLKSLKLIKVVFFSFPIFSRVYS